MNRARRAIGLLVLLVAAACAPRRPGLSPPPDPGALDAEIAAIEGRGAGSDAEALSRLGFLKWFARGDVPGALADLDRAIALENAGPTARLRHLGASLAAGRPDDVLADAAWLLARAPESAEAEVGLRLASTVDDASPRHAELLGPPLRATLDGPGGNPDLWFDAVSDLRTIEQRIGPPEEALARAYARRGAVQQWVLTTGWSRRPADEWLGPFPPLRDPDGDFGDEAHPPTAQATRKTTIEVRRKGGGVDLARTYVFLDRPADLIVVLGASDSARLEVDGLAVATLDRWERHEGETVRRALRLGAGWHRLVVRLARTGDSGWFFTYLLGAQGPPPPFRVEIRLPGDASVGDGRDVLPGPPSAVTATARLKAWAASSPSDPEPLYWLGRLLSEQGDEFAGKGTALKLLDTWPTAPGALEVGALSHSADDTVPRAARRDRAGERWRRLVAVAPDWHSASCALASVEDDIGDEEGELATLDAALARGGAAACLRAQRFRALLHRGWYGAAEADLRALEESAGGSLLALQTRLTWSRSRDQARRRAAASAVLAALGETLDGTTATLLDEIGRRDEALDIRRRIQALEPARWDPLLSLHRGLNQAGLAGEAAEVRARMRALAPDDPFPEAEEARAALARGDSGAALDHARRAVALDPADLDLVDLVALVSGDIDPFRPGFEPEETWRAFLAAGGDYERYPHVVVRQRREVRVLPGGAAVARLDRLVRVQSKRAVDRFAEGPSGGGETVLRFVSLKPDGRVVDSESPGSGHATLRDLEIGDAVFLSVRALVPPMRLPGGGVHAGSVVYGADDDCYTVKAEEVLRVAPGADARLWTPDRGAGWRQERGERGETVHLRTQEGVEPQPGEAYTPPRFDRGGWSVLAGPFDGLDLLAQRRAALRRAIRVNVEIQREADRLRVPGDPAATARAVHAAVAERVEGSAGGERFFSTDASRTWAERRGNATVLVAALLRAAGVPFEVHAVRSRAASTPDPVFPAEDYYFLPVIRVVAPSAEALWLVPSGRANPAGWLPETHRGAPSARLLPAPSAEDDPLGRTPDLAGELPGTALVLDLAVGADGTLAGTAEVRSFLNAESVFRDAFWNAEEDRRELVLEQWWSPLLPGIEVSAIERLGPTGATDPIRLRAAVRAVGILRGDGAAWEAPAFCPGFLGALDRDGVDLSAAFVGERRTLPLQLRAGSSRLEVRVRGVGPGAESAWPKITLAAPGVNLSQTASRDGDTVVLVRDLVTAVHRVAPADYPALRKRVLEALASTQRPVRLPVASAGTVGSGPGGGSGAETGAPAP